MNTKAEPYLPPKELGDALAALGVPGFEIRACRKLVRAMREAGAPVVRKKYTRASDASAWLTAHPTWRPFARCQKVAPVVALPASA